MTSVLITALFLSLTGPASLSSAVAKEAVTAEQIVEKADRIRFPAKGFQVDVKITTNKPNHDAEIKEYQVLSKGNERTLLKTTAPAIDKG
ncbi:MAG: outer membrane lipoprotein-sorting protein, partial [Gammaproteobacteria bacterium]